MNIWKETFGLFLWLIGSFASGWFGSRHMPGVWYDSLEKPKWTPPKGIFAPVWFLLYALMGFAAWLVWRQSGFSGAPVTLGLFVFLLGLNVLWSYLFFGRQRPGAAFFEIVVLWFVILATVVTFWRVRPAAGALMLPCLFWVGFASVLNFRLWRMNA
ncbi:TspO/MBR family protein [Thermodesulfobacteriota bacterium]